MNDLVNTQQPDNEPFRRALVAGGPGGNVGAIAVETERAIAEVQGQLTLAKRFPRSMVAAQMDFLDACKSPDFAATAFYAVPNRGSGPSIRFAEEVARCYGNFDYGHRELSRGAGKSEVEVYAWDKEKNNRSTRQITVEHILDSKQGPKVLRDQADIDNRIANVASKQMRGRILALVPKALVAAGIAECKRTIAGGGEKPLSEKIIGICKAFAAYGITAERLSKHLGHPVDQMTTDEYADLMGIGNAIKEGGKPSEFFPADSGIVEGEQPAGVQAIAAAAAAGKKATPAAAPAAAKPAAKAASKPTQAASKPAEDAPVQAVKNDEQAAAEPQADSPAQAAVPAAAEEEPDVF